MFSDINLYNPDFIIECNSLKKAKDVYSVMRDNGVKRMYCYAILYRLNLLQFEVLKIGESCPTPGPNTTPAVAERLGRQLAWVPGWSSGVKAQPKSEHGIGFALNLQHEIEAGKLPAHLYNRNELIVGVWDLDKRASSVGTVITQDSDIPKWVEGHLAHQYKKSHDMQLPVLNYKDPTKNKAYKTCNISTTLLDSLIRFE